jgi:hypothetical protein
MAIVSIACSYGGGSLDLLVCGTLCCEYSSPRGRRQQYWKRHRDHALLYFDFKTSRMQLPETLYSKT